MSRKRAAISCGAAEIAVGVDGEEAAGVVEVGVVADGGEDVEDFAVVRIGVADAVGGDDGEAQGAGEAEGGLVAEFLIAELVALELDVDIVAAVEGGELFEEGAGCGFAACCEGGGERTFVAAGEADEAVGILGEVVEGGGAFGFGGLAHFELGDELAEILIAGAGGAEEGETRGGPNALVRMLGCGSQGAWREARAECGGGDFCADVGADVVALAAGVHARGAVKAVAVEEGDGGDFEFLGAGDEVFGLGGAFEEGEGAGGVELDVISNSAVTYLPGLKPISFKSRLPTSAKTGRCRASPVWDPSRELFKAPVVHGCGAEGIAGDGAGEDGA